MNHIKLFEDYGQETQSVYYPKLGMSTEDAFRYVDYRDSCCNLYPGYDDDDADWTDEYWAETKEQAYAIVNDRLDILESLPDVIPVYRTIAVKSLADVDTEYLGDCWSFEKHSALEFGVHAGATVLLSGTIASEFIDWDTTVGLHFDLSGHGGTDDENEVRVSDATQIKDLEITWIGKKPSV